MTTAACVTSFASSGVLNTKACEAPVTAPPPLPSDALALAKVMDRVLPVHAAAIPETVTVVVSYFPEVAL